jgi:hypothetical protein
VALFVLETNYKAVANRSLPLLLVKTTIKLNILPMARPMEAEWSMNFLDGGYFRQTLSKKLLPKAHHGTTGPGMKPASIAVVDPITETYTNTRNPINEIKPVGTESRMSRDTLWSWWLDVQGSTTIIVDAHAALEDAVQKR